MSEIFDFIVVGGGSAGAVMAARLSEDPTFPICGLSDRSRVSEMVLCVLRTRHNRPNR